MTYDIMQVCGAAAGEVGEARRMMDEVPLVEVYKWLAIRLAEIPEP